MIPNVYRILSSHLIYTYILSSYQVFNSKLDRSVSNYSQYKNCRISGLGARPNTEFDKSGRIPETDFDIWPQHYVSGRPDIWVDTEFDIFPDNGNSGKPGLS